MYSRIANDIRFLQDQEINRLQRHLKEAEDILATALFQARQKLASIATANKRPVSSEELIKYAYRYVLHLVAILTPAKNSIRRTYIRF